MSRFKIGDRVVIVRSYVPDRIGVVTTVRSELRRSTYDRTLFVHQLDLPYGGPEKKWAGQPAVYTPDALEPYRDDGNEKAEWTDETRRICRVKEEA